MEVNLEGRRSPGEKTWSRFYQELRGAPASFLENARFEADRVTETIGWRDASDFAGA